MPIYPVSEIDPMQWAFATTALGTQLACSVEFVKFVTLNWSESLEERTWYYRVFTGSQVFGRTLAMREFLALGVYTLAEDMSFMYIWNCMLYPVPEVNRALLDAYECMLSTDPIGRTRWEKVLSMTRGDVIDLDPALYHSLELNLAEYI